MCVQALFPLIALYCLVSLFLNFHFLSKATHKKENSMVLNTNCHSFTDSCCITVYCKTSFPPLYVALSFSLFLCRSLQICMRLCSVCFIALFMSYYFFKIYFPLFSFLYLSLSLCARLHSIVLQSVLIFLS